MWIMSSVHRDTTLAITCIQTVWMFMIFSFNHKMICKSIEISSFSQFLLTSKPTFMSFPTRWATVPRPNVCKITLRSHISFNYMESFWMINRSSVANIFNVLHLPNPIIMHLFRSTVSIIRLALIVSFIFCFEQ